MNLLLDVLASETVAVIILKTALFSRIHHKKLKNWFYFDSFRINNSYTTESAKAKKRQNLLSFIIVILAVLTVVVKQYG